MVASNRRQHGSGAVVIGEFDLDSCRCWVISLKNEKQGQPCPKFGELPPVSEVFRFEMDGTRFAIVQQTSNAKSDPEPNLAMLLTARELQIATFVAMGCPNKQIADRLHISEWTVGTYLRRIFLKLGVDTRAAMTFRCASLIEIAQKSE